MPAHILIIEGLESPHQDLIELLEAQGYQVRTEGPEQAEYRLAIAPPDLVLLRLCRLGSETRPLYRRISQRVRALMVPLTLLIDECDGDGLPRDPEACLLSPLQPQHLVAAIRMLLRRGDVRFLATGDICLRLDEHQVRSGGRDHALTTKEFNLLETFMRHPHEVLSRRFLMKEVWKTDYLGDTRTLYVHVHLVREKIEPDPHKPRYLRTVRGVGYQFIPG